MSVNIDINRINGLELLKSYNFPKDKYILMNSAWQAILGIRKNGDLDVLVTPDILKQAESVVEKPVSIMKYLHWYVQPFGKTPEEVIKNHSVKINGVNVLKFGTYKKLLKIRAERGKVLPSAARLGKKSERDLKTVELLEDDGSGLPVGSL